MHKWFKLTLTTFASMPIASGVLAGDVEPAYRAAVNADLEWPKMDEATRKKGAFVPIANVVKIAPGMTKNQIYTLLDVPHFSEGLFGVKKWNYILNFYTGTGSEFVSCQYHIRYDRDYRVEATYWQSQQCADLVTKLAAAPSPQTIEKIVYVDRPIPAPAAVASQRNFIVTFDLGKANLDVSDIEILEAAVATARSIGSTQISVTGHTDTVGPEFANQRLREQRSENVAFALKKIASQGGVVLNVSKSTSVQLAVTTADETPEESNRRVTITIN
jgi:OOP family OmpA-OmpF porin